MLESIAEEKISEASHTMGNSRTAIKTAAYCLHGLFIILVMLDMVGTKISVEL